VADPRIDEARHEKNLYKARALKAERERDSLRSQVEAEAKRCRDLRKQWLAAAALAKSARSGVAQSCSEQMADVFGYSADRLQAILDSTSSKANQ
jgi:uncharacterized coiled-coil DUF342 family protein